MDSNTSTDKNTPAKSMQNILLEKVAHSKFPFGCDSPFKILPPASTPPSRAAIIKNPFESQLTEKLHRHVFSPSVFNNLTSSKTEEKFKWTIEDISSLKPADIDETTVEQFESTDQDPEMELTAQATIEKYFSEKHNVPSPFDAVVKSAPLISESTSPINVEQPKQLMDGIAQTVLTLPPNLPKHIEAVLKPYFSYTVDQQRDETNKNCSLYRRLFEYESEEQSPASVLTSPAPSCILSPIDFSPYDDAKLQRQRHFGSPQDLNQMVECNLSPIDSDRAQGTTRTTSSVTRLSFSGRMSVDTSLNVVPDTLDQMPSNNQSIGFESMHSPIPEVLSNSSINWDMEYKHISLESPKSGNSSLNENEMDVSTSNTPKSKIFMSQRKKLSDSFLKIEESDEEHDNKENIYEINNCIEKPALKGQFYIRDDTTDPGYHTGGGLTMCEESWSSSHLFASTPTKLKHDNRNA